MSTAVLWSRYCTLFDAGQYGEAANVYAAHLKAKAQEHATMKQPELFDTVAASPLFAGLPVAVPADAGRAPSPRRAQMPMCCTSCGETADRYITTRDGRAVCPECARALLQTKGK